jgi:hypothetical protein
MPDQDDDLRDDDWTLEYTSIAYGLGQRPTPAGAQSWPRRFAVAQRLCEALAAELRTAGEQRRRILSRALGRATALRTRALVNAAA